MAVGSVCLLCICIILGLGILTGLSGATVGETNANKTMVKAR